MSDGNDLYFYQGEPGQCQNTARMPDVVYHELGHGLHQYAIIPGAGAFDPALSEGTGDITAASVTHDPRLAPGFFVGTDAPLREMDGGRRWPDDISWDPHETGLIWAGAMWDLRTYLTADLGDDAGNARADLLYFQAIRRASNIPTTYAEVLAADDDDGDLSNGTPHVCAINRAFVDHGLASVLDASGLRLRHQAVSLAEARGKPIDIDVTAERLYPQCAATPLDSVDLRYRVGAVATQVELQGDGASYHGVIPAQVAGTSVAYTILGSAGGHEVTLPDNRADDTYSLFVGDPVPLYCNDFETQIDGWTFSNEKGKAGDFQWGTPAAKSTDPAAAHSGNKVIGDRLSGDGAYKRNQSSSATSPVIDRAGKKRIRLQLWRWLGVEDGAFDQASIYVNDGLIWQNMGTDETDGTLSHVDREWRFVDIDLAPSLGSAETIQVRFELTSDADQQLGGWNIDDFCIVTWDPPPPSYPIVSTLHHDDPAPEASDLVPSGGLRCALGSGEQGGSALWLVAALGLLRRARRRSAI
jgi:hypothetical protein